MLGTQAQTNQEEGLQQEAEDDIVNVSTDEHVKDDALGSIEIYIYKYI